MSGFAATALVVNGTQLNIGAYARDLHYDASHTASMLSVISASMIVGKLLFGSLTDRINVRWLFWAGAAILAAAMALLLAAPDFSILIAAVAMLGLAGGSIQPLWGSSMAARFGAASFGKVMGLGFIAINVSAFGAPALGRIYDVTSSYRIGFLTFLAVTLAAAGVFTLHQPLDCVRQPAVSRT
jgi:MFS family permease